MKELFTTSSSHMYGSSLHGLIRVEEAESPIQGAQNFVDSLQLTSKYILSPVNNESEFVATPEDEFVSHEKTNVKYENHDLSDECFLIKSQPLHRILGRTVHARSHEIFKR